jgi:zinc transport system ATP-binding protein
MLLKVIDLKVVLEGNVILENINFEIEEGERVGVIGPNGGGKTTLLRALTFQIPYEGKIIYKEGIKVVLVPQIKNINKFFPLNVKEFFSLFDMNINDIKNFLSDDIFKKKISNLSEGELQKILILQSIFQKPDLLLLDEPTSFLDPKNKENVFSLLENFYKERQFSVLVVSHDLSFISSFAQRIICLNKNLICDGFLNQITPEVLERLYGYKVGIYKHKH